MGLLPSTAVLSGSVKFAGQEVLGLDAKQMRHLWGREMSMVFQNPMVSLNPVMKVGKQIVEPLQIHLGMGRTDARGDRRSSCCVTCASPSPSVASISTRTSSRVACASGS